MSILLLRPIIRSSDAFEYIQKQSTIIGIGIVFIKILAIGEPLARRL
jgi:hypothetical protein